MAGARCGTSASVPSSGSGPPLSGGPWGRPSPGTEIVSRGPRPPSGARTPCSILRPRPRSGHAAGVLSGLDGVRLGREQTVGLVELARAAADDGRRSPDRVPVGGDAARPVLVVRGRRPGGGVVVLR